MESHEYDLLKREQQEYDRVFEFEKELASFQEETDDLFDEIQERVDKILEIEKNYENDYTDFVSKILKSMM